MRKNIKFYPYIDDIAYNEFELKEEVWYGNGTHVHYAYDTLQRLDTLRSYDGLDSLMQDIHYTYDSVGNITDIENYAPVLPNGLGGPYSHHHDYDSFYRIEHSEGWWGQTPLSYTLDMEYHDNGRIQRKTLSSDTWLEGVLASMNYDNAYHYTNPLQPNTLAYIGNGPQQTFEWDAKRNLTYHWNDMTRLKRYLGWDEENRLTSYSKGNTRVFYRYDAQGERFYKNTGNTTAYGNPTLYASPYLVAAGNEYTKHYYIEDERFACRIGDGAFPDIDSAVVSNALLSAKQLEVNDAALDSIVPNQFDFLRTRQGQWSSQHTTYWQHSDHLGSASWITDTSGCAVQHLQYMPWGEPLLDYRNSSFNTRYTFSGKERDEETGYSYFGARYYNSAYSIWMSIDPMSDKYPSISPYVYCGNNPVKCVDPRGEEIGPIWPKKGVNTYSCKLKAGVGIGYGVAISGMIGISLDPHGMTHWTAYNPKYIVNQNIFDKSSNPAIEVGIDVSLSGNFERNYNYDSFIDAAKSSSTSISFAGKDIVGVNIGGGDDSFSIGVGIGLSVGAAGDPYQNMESVSLSKQEARKAGYFSSWSVGNIQYVPSGDYYQGTVKTKDGNTDIVVKASAITIDGQRSPSGIWKSEAY